MIRAETNNSQWKENPVPGKGKIEKELCDWTHTELRVHFDQLQKIVSKPAFVCTKCGRAANRKKWLCKAQKLRS